MKIASNYVDMGQMAARSAGGVIDPQEVFESLTGKESRIVPGRNGGTETVTAEQELEELIGKMKEDMAAAAPDVSELLTNPSIDPGPAPHTIRVEDQVIDARSVGGAVMVELIRAQMRGEGTEAIESDLRELADDDISEGRGFYLNTTSRWPGGVINYRFSTDGISNSLQEKFNRAAAEWTRKTGIKLVRNESFGRYVSGNTYGIPYVTINVHNKNYSNSTVGADAGINSRINLSPEATMATIRHEIGHTIGLHHEHQRPDRYFNVRGLFKWDDNYRIIWSYWLRYHITYQRVPIRFLFFTFYVWVPVLRVELVDESRRTAYDYFSIMHYGNPFYLEKDSDKFWRARRRQVAYIFNEEQGRVVRYEINPGDIVWGMYTTKSISPLDIQAVNRMY